MELGKHGIGSRRYKNCDIGSLSNTDESMELGSHGARPYDPIYMTV